MFKPILLIILGFTLLIKGADILIDGASNVAKKFHIPEIIIGLTIISIGTSMPELFVSITSAVEGHTDMSIGNVIGSNLVNLMLILGITSMIHPIEFKKETKWIEIPLSLFFSILFLILCNVGSELSKFDGIILIFFFSLFIFYTIIMARKGEEFEYGQLKNLKSKKEKIKPLEVVKDIIYIIVGIILLRIGGNFSVDNAVIIAQTIGLSEKLIGVTILAIGTSLPELVTSVSSACKGKNDIAIGNIIGSCIFNMLFITGITSLITPLWYNTIYNIDMIILLVSSLVLALFPVIPPKNQMSRMNGLVYFVMYVIYLVTLFI